MIHVGIDPGKHGAICILDCGEEILPTPESVPVFIDMPIAIQQRSRDTIEVIDVMKIVEILEPRLFEDLHVTVEHIWDFAGAQGDNKGRAQFLLDYGRLRGALETLRINYLLAAPKSWEAAHKKPKTPRPPEPPEHITDEKKRWRWQKNWREKWNKDWNCAKAAEAFPKASLIPPRCYTPHEGRADALLILNYGAMRVYMQQYTRKKK